MGNKKGGMQQHPLFLSADPHEPWLLKDPA